jgi:hypothetical protein
MDLKYSFAYGLYSGVMVFLGVNIVLSRTEIILGFER